MYGILGTEKATTLNFKIFATFDEDDRLRIQSHACKHVACFETLMKNLNFGTLLYIIKCFLCTNLASGKKSAAIVQIK